MLYFFAFRIKPYFKGLEMTFNVRSVRSKEQVQNMSYEGYSDSRRSEKMIELVESLISNLG